MFSETLPPDSGHQRGTENSTNETQHWGYIYLPALEKELFHCSRMRFLWSVSAVCCNSSLWRRKSSGAMCSLSVYSAFIRHPVPQAAFWKAVFIGAFLFMLRGGRSALTALCWIRSSCLHSKTLCRRMCVCVWETEENGGIVSAGQWDWFKAMWVWLDG